MEVERKHLLTVWVLSYLSPSIHPPRPGAPPSPLFLFIASSIAAHSSKSQLLTKSDAPFAPTKTFYLPPTWNCFRISFSFFFSVLFFWVSALIYHAAPLVFHFMEQRGCRPPPPTPLSATDRNGRTCRGKAAQLSSPASCVALKTKTWSRELEVVGEAVKSSACSLSLFPRSKRARPHCDGKLVVDLWTQSESDVLFERVNGIKTSSRNLFVFFRGSFFNQVSK